MRFALVSQLLLIVALAGCTAQEELPESSALDETVGYLTSETFDEEVQESEVPVLVDFTAVWCGPCKILDPIIESLMPEMAGRAKVVKVDIDASPDVYERLRVNGVPTVVFFNDGVEQDRISSPQSRETYVKYLEAMMEGRSAFEASLSFLDDDSFRRHFLVSRMPDEIREALQEHPHLLVQPFENGQTPLSLILNSPSIRQNAQLELVLAQDPVISPGDLAGLGRCDELDAALADDPEAANRPDPDGATPLWVALMRSHRLENGGCVRTLLDAGADPSGGQHEKFFLTRAVILKDDVDLLREFLERGMDPEAIDELGQNALHWATIYGQVDAVGLLLEHGVAPDAKNHEGKTVVDMVREGRERWAVRLQEVGPDDSPDYRADVSKRVEEYDEMLVLLERASG